MTVCLRKIIVLFLCVYSVKAGLSAEELLTKNLQGILILNSFAKMRTEGVLVEDMEGRFVRYDGLTPQQPRYLESKLVPFTGIPLGVAQLGEIIAVIKQHYVDTNKRIILVKTPPQPLLNDIIQIVVLEAKVGKIRVEGNKWYSKKLYESKFQAKEGAPLDNEKIQEDIQYINQNPFRSVNAIYESGDVEGETNVVLEVQDKIPFRVTASVDDSGNALTEDERTSLSIIWGKPMGLDHMFSYSISGNPSFDLLNSHSGSYTIPLPWRHTLSLSGNYATNGAKFPDPTLQIEGESWGWGANYSMPLPKLGKVTQQLSAGYKFSRSNNSLAFNQIQVSDTVADVSQFSISYNMSLQDTKGITTGGVTAHYSPGGMTKHNTDAKLASSGAGSSSYEYLQVKAGRITRLPMNFLWSVNTSFQVGSNRLPGSEKFGFGGYTTLPGYDEREANGDWGYTIITDIQSPGYSLSKLIGKSWKDQLIAKVFAGYGTTSAKGADNSTVNPNIALMSFGPGLRYSFADRVNMRLDYGFQLKDSGGSLLTRRGYNHRGHFSLGLTF